MTDFRVDNDPRLSNLLVKDRIFVDGLSDNACVKAKESMDRLDEIFKQVDAGFNTKGGLSVDEFQALTDGIFVDDITVTTFYGPAGLDQCGHTTHTAQPGALTGFGNRQGWALTRLSEVLFLTDPLFPFDDTETFVDAPKIFHARPTIEGCFANNLVRVISRVFLRYAGGGGTPTEPDSPLVVIETGNAMYELVYDEQGNAKVPVALWINFTIEYTDCDPNESILDQIE